MKQLDFPDFVEQVLGIRLPHYQKELYGVMSKGGVDVVVRYPREIGRKTMEKHWKAYQGYLASSPQNN